MSEMKSEDILYKVLEKSQDSTPDGIWNQIKEVLQSNHIEASHKQRIIAELRYLIVRGGPGELLTVNSPLISEVLESINSHYPNLHSDLINLILKSKRHRDALSDVLPVDYFVQTFLFMIVVSLQVKQSVYKPVLITHFSLYFSEIRLRQLSPCDDSATELDEDGLHEILCDVLSFRYDISKMSVRNMSEDKKAIWRLLLSLIDFLVLENFLIEASSKDFARSELRDEYIEEEKSRFGNSGYPFRTIVLSSDIKKELNPRTHFILSKWPKLVSPIYIDKYPKPFHSELKKGKSTLTTSPLFFYQMKVIGSVPLAYDSHLFLEALRNIDGEEMFDAYNKFDINESEENLVKHRSAFLNTQVISDNILHLQRLRTLVEFFSETNYSIALWLQLLVKKLPKKEKEELSPFVLSFHNLQDLSSFDTYTLPYFKFIIENCDTQIFHEQFDTLLTDFLSTLGNVNQTPREAAILNRVLITLGLNRISSFYYLSKLYPQSSPNIFFLWNSRLQNNKDLSNNERETLKLIDQCYREYKKAEKIHTYVFSLTALQSLMELYGSQEFYLYPLISANGRLTYQGFAPSPHSGDIFGFTQLADKQLIDSRGLIHLKRSISCSFKNHFNTLEEHEEWFDQNLETILKNKYSSIKSFIYIDALEKAINNQPTGCITRIDQVSSVLFYWALIADCDYYKEITNLINDPAEIFKPYQKIANDYLKPCLEKMKSELEESKPGSLNSTVKMVLVDCLLPNIVNDKSLNKSLIMPHSYGLTYKGVAEAIIEYAGEFFNKDFSKLEENNLFTKLCLKIYHKLNEVSPRSTAIRKICEGVELKFFNFVKIFKEKGVNQDTYSNVFSLPTVNIFWDYKLKSSYTYKVRSTALGKPRKHTLNEITDKSDSRQNQNSLPPLLIHSVDGSVIQLTAYYCYIKGGFYCLTTHDCAGVHPNNIDKLLYFWKTSIIDIMGKGKLPNKTFLERIWFNPTVNYLLNSVPDSKKPLAEFYLQEIREYWDTKWSGGKPGKLISELKYFMGDNIKNKLKAELKSKEIEIKDVHPDSVRQLKNRFRKELRLVIDQLWLTRLHPNNKIQLLNTIYLIRQLRFSLENDLLALKERYKINGGVDYENSDFKNNRIVLKRKYKRKINELQKKIILSKLIRKRLRGTKKKKESLIRIIKCKEVLNSKYNLMYE